MSPRRPTGGRVAWRRWSPLERELRASAGPMIAGVDEVGRGPLAGPVVACAVIMPPDSRAIPGIDDSKRLTRVDRERYAERIRERAVCVALGAASVREIERLNIYQASALAMSRALRRMRPAPDHVIVDGRPIRTLGVPHTAVVGGDGCCYSIACASIVAKVTRDRVMAALALRYPAYRWERNVGYATPNHLEGMEHAGLTPHHRRTFLYVRQQLSLPFGDSVPCASEEHECLEAAGEELHALEEALMDAGKGAATGREPARDDSRFAGMPAGVPPGVSSEAVVR